MQVLNWISLVLKSYSIVFGFLQWSLAKSWLENTLIIKWTRISSEGLLLLSQVFSINGNFFLAAINILEEDLVSGISSVRDQLSLRCDWVNHLSEHLGSVFELQPEFTTSIHTLLSFEVNCLIFHGDLFVNLLVSFLQAEDKVILHHEGGTEASRTNEVLVDLDYTVVAGVAKFSVLSDQW